MSTAPRTPTGLPRILGYGVALAGLALLLEWLDFRWRVRSLALEVYLVAVAILFGALGALLAVRLTRRRPRPGDGFEPNRRAMDYLGITDREAELLEMLAEGASNREIAKRAFISENTVKTHLSNLYGKLEVSRRTQAVRKARDLGFLP